MKDLFLTFENYTWAKGKDEGPRRLNKLGGVGVILALFYLFFIVFMYLFLAALGLVVVAGLPLAAMSRGYSLVEVHGLIATASLVAEHGLWGSSQVTQA